MADIIQRRTYTHKRVKPLYVYNIAEMIKCYYSPTENSQLISFITFNRAIIAIVNLAEIVDEGIVAKSSSKTYVVRSAIFQFGINQIIAGSIILLIWGYKHKVIAMKVNKAH